MKIIEIKEETKIPGTNYVLEAGDRIQIESKKEDELKESFFFSAGDINDIKKLIVDRIIRPNIDSEYSAGVAFMRELDAAIGDQLDDDAMIAFYKGLKAGLEDIA